MWTRKELKSKAKARLSANYWRMVLVAFIIALLTGSVGTFTYKISDKDINVKEIFSSDYKPQNKLDEFTDNISAAAEHVTDAVNSSAFDEEVLPVAAAILIVILVIILIAVLVSAGISIFLINPLKVGSEGFFISNADTDGELSNLGLAFRKNYKQIVLGMFLKGVYIFLWSLLLIIPGIIKAYEYSMVPYILADNPTISQRDAFELSKRMMHGNKWKAFVLDLSFIGWELLSAVTLGILGIFYVNPYRKQTDANLYLALRGPVVNAESTVYDNYIEMV